MSFDNQKNYYLTIRDMIIKSCTKKLEELFNLKLKLHNPIYKIKTLLN